MSRASNSHGSTEPTAGPEVMSADQRRGLSFYAAPLIIFFLTRAALAFLAHAAPSLLTPLHKNPSVLPHSDPLARAWSWTSPWFRFDARWYVDVAEHGYRYGALSATNTNFFPLYPLLIRAVQPITGGSAWIAAWLVANLAFLAATLLLWTWATERWNRDIALRTVLLTTCFPFAFFFMAPYAEPLFLALAVAAFLFAERDRWVLATICAGLSTVTRPVGVAVVLALVVLALLRGERDRAAIAALGIAPFLAFVAFLWLDTGHPLAFTVYHTAGWVAPHGGLLTTIGSQFHTSLSPFDRVDAAAAVLFLASSIAVWRRVGPPYALYVIAGVALPLVRSLAGLERYVIVLFPAMAAWALWHSKIGQAAIFCISILGLVLATCMFATGYSIF